MRELDENAIIVADLCFMEVRMASDTTARAVRAAITGYLWAVENADKLAEAHISVPSLNEMRHMLQEEGYLDVR